MPSDPVTFPHAAKQTLFLSGPPGCGKTTLGVRRLEHLIAHDVPGEQILTLVPQRTLAAPYYEALHTPEAPAGSMVTVATIGGLARRTLELFWPLIAEPAGFRPNYPPHFLTLETAQYYMDRVIEEARSGDGVKTMMGRRRFLRAITSRNHAERTYAERMARNTPVQGTAADIIKLAMVQVHEALEAQGFEAKMVLTVHDELVFDVPEAERPDVEKLVRSIMEGALELDVPLLVDVGWGEDWGDAHP